HPTKEYPDNQKIQPSSTIHYLFKKDRARQKKNKKRNRKPLGTNGASVVVNKKWVERNEQNKHKSKQVVFTQSTSLICHAIT
ncbi:MAG: hypothetical protein VW684_12615, partial [Betaproteobacteria bacterium]